MANDETNRNRPKAPKIIDLDYTEYGQGLEDRAAFWSAGRSTSRGRIFWMDIETTGLGKEVETTLGPERWNEIVKTLDAETSIPNKLKRFKRLSQYKYFEQIGLAQFVTHNRTGPNVRQGGMPPWAHGAGYTIWEDNFANTLKSKRFDVSEFSRRKGIKTVYRGDWTW